MITRLSAFLLFLYPGFICAFAQNAALQQTSCLSAEDWHKLPAHPRLFVSDQLIDKITQQNDSVSLQLKYILQHQAAQHLRAAPIVYPDGINNMVTARNVQGRILSLALHYRLTGNSESLARARAELIELCELKNWGTGHFLDVGEAAFAAGVGFDWLYDGLSSEQRQQVATAITNLAILPALAVKEGGDSWVKGNFNWNPVCNGGVMVAALAIAESQPELAKKNTERAIENLPYAAEAYSLDGAFPEGPSYWAYGTSFYLIAVL